MEVKMFTVCYQLGEDFGREVSDSLDNFILLEIMNVSTQGKCSVPCLPP